MEHNKHASAHTPPRKLYIFGAGGSGREIAWLAQDKWGPELEITFLVDDARYLSAPVNGIDVELLSSSKPGPDTRLIVALGNCLSRRQATQKCADLGHISATLIHPNAIISPWTKIGIGTSIAAGVIITTNVTIGDHAQINIGCTVSHDVILGNFSTLSPGVRIAGHVLIEDDVFIGINACIINGSPGKPLLIGNGATIAAGACVTKPVAPRSVVAGVPAARKR